MDRDAMGELIATKGVLQSALKLLSIEQMRTLHDIESGTLADLTQLWSSSGAPSDSQEGFLNELKRITFRLTHRLDLMESGESEDVSVDPTDVQFFCIQCNMPAPYLGLGNTVCPTCGSDKFLEAI